MDNNLRQREFKSELRDAFKNYTSWNSRLENKLHNIGFDIESKNHKHAIIRINYDGKSYVFSISKTPSDYRAGMNNVSIIYRSIFGHR